MNFLSKKIVEYAIQKELRNELNFDVQADLDIFSIKDFKGLAMNYGARWMTDIIDNNAYRQKYHPFK